MSYRDIILADSPIAYWRLGESSGTSAADETANNHDGTYTGGYTLAQTGALAGDADTAVLLNGSTGYVSIGNPAGLQVSTGSIEAWIKTSSPGSSYRAILTKPYAYGLYLVDGVLLTYDWSGGGNQTTSINIADGAWHHVVFTFQSGVTNGSHIYLDGVSVGTFTCTISAQTNPLALGADISSGAIQHIAGTLDDIAVYGTALTSTQVADHYNAGITSPLGPGEYTVTFTPSDTRSTAANELTYQVRTATGGGGTLLASGTATSGTPVTTAAIDDAGLVNGANTRWLRLTDGAGNVLDQSFTVNAAGFGVAVGMNHITSTVTMYSPGVSPGAVNVGMQHIANTPAVNNPGVSPGAVSIAAQHIASVATLYQPGVETAGQFIAAQHIDSTAMVHEQGVSYAQSIGGLHIASTVDVHTPGVSYLQSIGMQHIGSGVLLYAPGVTPGTAFIGGEHIAATVALYQPGVTVGGVTIGMLHIASTVTLYQFGVSGGLVKTVQIVSRARERYYTVEIQPPLGREPRYLLDYDDINALVTALSWSTGVGGWAQALVGIAHPLANERYGAPLAHPHLKRTLHTKPFAHIEIRRNGRVVYAGRLGPLQRGMAGVVTGLVVPGYGVVATRDNPYSNTSATSVTVGTILKSIISNSAPHLKAATGDDWQDPGVSHTYSEFHRLTLGDALAQVVSEGTSRGETVDWWVYEDQRLALKTRQEPETPDYTLPFDNRVTGWVEDDTQMIGAVTHARMSSGVEINSVDFDTDDGFADEHGFLRSEKLALGTVSAASALAIRMTYLRTHSKPIVSGALEFGPDDALEGPYGRTRPKDAARAGQWVQVGNEPIQMVMTTDYDATADVLRMEIGAYQPSFETLIAAFQQARLWQQRGLNAYGGKR